MASRLLAEFLGTFILVTAILFTGQPLFIAAGFLAAITIAGSISGGHVNPAVSLAMFANGDLSAGALTQYMGAQFAGALFALLVFRMIKKM